MKFDRLINRTIRYLNLFLMIFHSLELIHSAESHICFNSRSVSRLFDKKNFEASKVYSLPKTDPDTM